MQPADRKANPHCYPVTQTDIQTPAPSSWLGRVVVRVREHFGGVAPAPLGLPAPGVPAHLQSHVIPRDTPLDANVDRHRAHGIEFSNLESAQAYSAFVAGANGIGRGGRRGAITGPAPQQE